MQVSGTKTQYPIQSYYPYTELTNPRRILLLLSVGSSEKQFEDGILKCEPMLNYVWHARQSSGTIVILIGLIWLNIPLHAAIKQCLLL